MVTVPVLGVVLNVPALLPDTAIGIVKGQLPVHVQHLDVWRWDGVLANRTLIIVVVGVLVGIYHVLIDKVPGVYVDGLLLPWKGLAHVGVFFALAWSAIVFPVTTLFMSGQVIGHFVVIAIGADLKGVGGE